MANEARIIANRQAGAGRELLRWADGHRAEMIRLIALLVEHESPSANPKAVDALGEVLAGVLTDAGGRVRRHRVQRFGAHVQADFDGERGGRPVLLLGHFDTVWELGTLKSMPFRQAKGRLWGPGVLDMKTGIAQMVFALEALRQVRGRLPRPATVLLVTDEEAGSESSRDLTEKLAQKSAAVLVCEPSFALDGKLKTARKGVCDYLVRVRGRAAHAGLDHQRGNNAIVELARQIVRISEFSEGQRGITVSPGVIRGGTVRNVIAPWAECEVDARIAKLKDAARLERKFRSLRPFDHGCTVEVTGGINRPPLERRPAVIRLYEKARALAAELGFEVGEAAVGGGSDGNFTAALGIPTLDGLGAVGEGAHAVHESVLLSELPRRTALLARLVESL